MNSFFVKWKTAAYFCLATALICLGTKRPCFAAEDSVKYDAALQASKITDTVCSPKGITVSGYLYVKRRNVPTGAEIYRAKVRADGTQENFKKIGICTRFTQGKQNPEKWKLTYKDNTVKTGQAYVYKFRGYKKSGQTTGFQWAQFKTRKAVAARETGEYTCKIIKNTSASLVLKLKGIHKNNGPLECYIDDIHSYSVFLVCKNKGKKETLKSIIPKAYSYNGKKWHSGQSFTVRGKQNIYLRFSGEDIQVSRYRYVQMMMGYMRYNLCPRGAKDTAMPQMRFNLASGKASVGDYIIWDSNQWEWVTKWDKDQLKYKIPVIKDTDIIYSYLNYSNCSPDSITVNGELRNYCKGYLDTTGSDISPAGVEIYRATVKENGESSVFQKIGVCRNFEYNSSDSSYDEWRFMYTDSGVTTGQSYAYQTRPFIETKNTRKFQKEDCISGILKGTAANGVGKYTCEIITNTPDTLIIKVTGKDEKNGPLACRLFNEMTDTHIVYKNDCETQIHKLISIEAYSYDGKKWFRGNDSIKGTEAFYLRFGRPYTGGFENFSNYQHVQIMVICMDYNLSSICQLRMDLSTKEASTGNFRIWSQDKEYYWLLWDGEIFESVYVRNEGM